MFGVDFGDDFFGNGVGGVVICYQFVKDCFQQEQWKIGDDIVVKCWYEYLCICGDDGQIVLYDYGQ